jgi:hypothetical protein
MEGNSRGERCESVNQDTSPAKAGITATIARRAGFGWGVPPAGIFLVGE